jgi:hypothetical protein
VVLAIRCKDGQYHLDAGGDHDDPWPEPSYAATTGEDTWFAVICGTEWGEVSVRVQLVREPSEVPDAQLVDKEWELITERDIDVEGQSISILELNTPQPFHQIKTGPGLFRVRLHMRNRQQAFEAGDFSGPIERHWLLVWPTTTAAPVLLLRGPDTFAQSY